jgi:hypothetical protein
MARSMPENTRDAIEADIEAGKAPALIAAEHQIGLATVYQMRRQVQALRRKHDLEPLPVQPRERKGFSSQEDVIRAEFLQTGAIRPLARKHGITVDRLRHLLSRFPSVLREREKKTQAEAQVQQ